LFIFINLILIFLFTFSPSPPFTLTFTFTLLSFTLSLTLPPPFTYFPYLSPHFSKEQVRKAKSYIESSKYSEALSILEPISSNHQSMKSDYEILFWIGHCHEYLQNFQLADKYYKICADYSHDDGYWEATYGTFLLKNSNLNHDEWIEKGIDRLTSAANKKRFVSAMYILGKIYINGLYDVKQDFRKGEFYLRRAYNGGDKDRSWSTYEKIAKELVKDGQLSKVPEEHVWAKRS
jgi:TPR repeat protein